MLLRRLSALAARRQPVAKELVLTPRQAQIFRMLEMGPSDRKIAEQLRITIHTVTNHVHSVLTKLGAQQSRRSRGARPYHPTHRGQQRN